MKPKIITIPNPLLRQKSKPINPPVGGDKKVKKLFDQMVKVLKTTKEPGGGKYVGLSAVQIGRPVRLFIIQRKKKYEAFVNPKITWHSKKMLSQTIKGNRVYLEGCFSAPLYYGFVNRPATAKLKWRDLEGKKHQEKFTGPEAIYIQHEYDHLEGVLFIDRILRQKGQIYKLEKRGRQENLIEVEI